MTREQHRRALGLVDRVFAVEFPDLELLALEHHPTRLTTAVVARIRAQAEASQALCAGCQQALASLPEEAGRC